MEQPYRKAPTTMRITTTILFMLSTAALVAALVTAFVCMVAGSPEAAYPMVGALALVGIATGAVAIVISGMDRRRRHIHARSIQPHGNG